MRCLLTWEALHEDFEVSPQTCDLVVVLYLSVFEPDTHKNLAKQKRKLHVTIKRLYLVSTILIYSVTIRASCSSSRNLYFHFQHFQHSGIHRGDHLRLSGRLYGSSWEAQWFHNQQIGMKSTSQQKVISKNGWSPPNDEISKTTNKTKLLQLWLLDPLLSFLSYFIIFDPSDEPICCYFLYNTCHISLQAVSFCRVVSEALQLEQEEALLNFRPWDIRGGAVEFSAKPRIRSKKSRPWTWCCHHFAVFHETQTKLLN